MTKPGIHIMPAAEYHADPCDAPSLSSSIARLLLTRSPLHAWTAHPRLNKHAAPQESARLDLGTAAHAMLLEGEESIAVIDPQDHVGARGAVPKGWTTDAMREARDAARAAGQTPILPADMADIRAMVAAATKAIAGCEDLAGLTLTDGTAEQVVIWQEGDVWCRSRPDWMSHDRRIQISYKSTAASANPESWLRTGMGIGFDVQDAFYLRGNRATGAPKDCVSLTLVQENEPPYACAWVGLDPAFAAWAEERVAEAIELWRRCMASGRWPGYASRVHWLEPPAWAVASWESRTAMPIGRISSTAFSEDDLRDGIPL